MNLGEMMMVRSALSFGSTHKGRRGIRQQEHQGGTTET